MTEIDPRKLDGKEYHPFTFTTCDGGKESMFCLEGDSLKISFCNSIKQSIPEVINYKIISGKFKLL